MEWLQNNWAVIATVLWGICEVLANVPSIKSSSVFQLIYNLLKSVLGKVAPTKDAEPK